VTRRELLVPVWTPLFNLVTDDSKAIFSGESEFASGKVFDGLEAASE
jgi:hypothetical protein